MDSQFTYAVFTDKGGREINEDSIGVCSNETNNCFVLCDGLGGHGMGDVASSLVIDVFREQFGTIDSTADFIGKTFMVAQNVLMAEQVARKAKRKMKTTAAAVVMDEKYAYIGYIGDSRVYVFNKNKVKVRTLDHSIPQMLVLTGEIKESEIRYHQDRNTLLRVMGIEWGEAMYEMIEPLPLKKCQAFLLCSDGFWELIDEKKMCELLKKTNTVDEWLEEMTAIVQKNGNGRNMDNYSAIAVWHN